MNVESVMATDIQYIHRSVVYKLECSVSSMKMLPVEGLNH
jgi:hypothetical protein